MRLPCPGMRLPPQEHMAGMLQLERALFYSLPGYETPPKAGYETIRGMSYLRASSLSSSPVCSHGVHPTVNETALR